MTDRTSREPMPVDDSRGWMEPKAARAWLAVAACVALIMVLSADYFSTTSTSRFLGPLLRWLFPEIDQAALWEIHLLVRKAAHVLEYAALALLGYRALRLSGAGTPLFQAALALALVAVVAGVDEFRQSFSAARTGSLTTVALDLTGGAAALVLAVSLRRSPRVERWFPSTPKSG